MELALIEQNLCYKQVAPPGLKRFSIDLFGLISIARRAKDGFFVFIRG